MSSNVNIKVKFFASARDVVGSKQIEMDIKKGSTNTDVLETLIDKYPGLKDLKDQLILAVNKQTGKNDKVLEEGDEIAVLPPVSGG